MARKTKTYWLVEYGNIYEGGYNREVFATKELADQYAARLSAKHLENNPQRDQYYVDVEEVDILNFVPEV